MAREKQRLTDGGSILDRLRLDAKALQARVSAADGRKLDAYFQAVRTAESELVEVRLGSTGPSLRLTWTRPPTATTRPT